MESSDSEEEPLFLRMKTKRAPTAPFPDLSQ
jgi:hypothetical protein